MGNKYMTKTIKKTNHYVYKTILAGSDKYYIGRHSTTKEDILNDGYMGSGKWVKSIKDKSRLTKIILGVYDTMDELLIAEETYIKEHFEDPNNMNILCSSEGFRYGELHPFYGKPLSEELRQKLSGENNHQYGKRGALAPNYGKRGELSPNYGRKHSEEFKQKISTSLKGKYVGEKNWNYGRTHSEETKEKLSEAKKGEKNNWYGRTHSKESKEKMSDAKRGENNSMYGKTGELAPNYGIKRTKESKQKQSDSLMGKYYGEKNSNAKLNEYKVLEIREKYAADGITQTQLAQEYGVSRGAITGILFRTTWKHI